MNDDHSFERDGVKWKRVFTVPQASIATKIDPFSQSQFVRSMDGKTDSLGESWDRSAEMSAKRAEQNGGVDPVKEKYFADYKKKTGKDALASKPKTIETPNFKAEF